MDNPERGERTTAKDLQKTLQTAEVFLHVYQKALQKTTKTGPPGLFHNAFGKMFRGQNAQHCLEQTNAKTQIWRMVEGSLWILHCLASSGPACQDTFQSSKDEWIQKSIKIFYRKSFMTDFRLLGVATRQWPKAQILRPDHKSVEMLWHKEGCATTNILLGWNIFVRDGSKLVNSLTSSHRKIVVLLQVSDSMFHLFLHPTLWLITQ